ncbi:hypothetical protein C8K30_110160 [Promicromonospora sp. AC04]|uniref:Ig-like domain repeat protein n=1 Tax=Promicromonospora sp. AC04 TaxID=2135723 RepID=UPI000D4BA548|nr:Ig-like domain repeat protein [Promicromonospora sp. AC04]PUB24016.1 hypothetical protein C8K30_110160 [Promicromonospora sp. AC04]
MKRSLIAGATVAGMLFGAFVAPATVAASAETTPSPEVDCGITVWGEAEAVSLAEACDKDVEVMGATGDGARLFAEPDGEMRIEASGLDPYVTTGAAARTALNRASGGDYGWTGTRWVGYCDPAEYAEGCDAAGVQRLAWQFDGIGILEDLAPGDITSAELILNSNVAWLDNVDCTPSTLDLYDIPRISASTGWSSTSAWTADRRAGDITFYAPACEQSPGYTGYFDFDATQLAVNAVRDDRSSVTVGVRAADETCMACGWTSFKPSATLIIRFNRAPLTPTDLMIGSADLGWGQACSAERVMRTTTPRLSADITDPDPASNPDESAPVTATFRVARADAPDDVLWEGSESSSHADRHSLSVSSGILENGARYVWSVFGTDDGGLAGPIASCTFAVDISAPAAPIIMPLVGGQAVYLERTVRGGLGVPGSFLLTSSSDDVTRYRYGVNTQIPSNEIVATENTVLNIAPTRTGLNYLSIDAIDKAGNVSAQVIFEFYVSFNAPVPPPPAITVTGPTSYTFGDVVTASVTLSDDAATPYGTVTVRSGSTVVGSAAFDERTEELELDGQALGAGTKALTFTYQAFSNAPAWSTQRTVTVTPLVFSISRLPSISGTAQVGQTLTAMRWTWTPTPTTVKYQWRLDGQAVSGATSRTWTVPASAKGKRVTVAITGSKTGYTTKTAVSPSTTTVKAGAFVAPRPTITGTAKVGSTLKAVRGTWTPQPSTVKYQWKVGGVAVTGATDYWFKVPASAKGKRIAVVVTGSKPGYVTKTVTSPLTSVIR